MEDVYGQDQERDSVTDSGISSILAEEIKQTQENHKLIASQYLACQDWRSGFPWDHEIGRVNTQIFKNKSFLNRQREIINAVKAKRDTIALIPTGHGKSLTFQLPAVTDSGITFVIMPLLSLIEDQVQKLKDIGVEAVFVHGSNDIGDTLSKLRSGDHKERLFYVTPEQLMNNDALQSIMRHLYDK